MVVSRDRNSIAVMLCASSASIAARKLSSKIYK